MATDLEEILSNLNQFYSFKGKNVVSVGAGGGQFAAYGKQAKHIWAVDNDEEAIRQLSDHLQNLDYRNVFSPVCIEFDKFFKPAEVVFFEFSLHEMVNPIHALQHSLAMAPEVVVMDHVADSDWAYIVSEENKARASWKAISETGVQKLKRIETVQYFKDYHELFDKVKVQGEKTISRISKYKGKINFSIPMVYELALIKRSPNS